MPSAGRDAITCAAMRKGTDDGWFFPQNRERESVNMEDYIGRQVLWAHVLVCLEAIHARTDDREIIWYVSSAAQGLNELYEHSEDVIARHEAGREWDYFRLLHRQLVGSAVEFSALADGRPEQSCGAFKARQLNGVLQPLKERMEEDMCVTLPLAAEDGTHSYSDVCIILRTYLDVCAAYVQRYYDGNPPVNPPVPANMPARIIRNLILSFCMDEPRGILEIGEMLGYKDKKTIRKYLNPLLDEGLIGRTVPDKPNSRNQKYLTARHC